MWLILSNHINLIKLLLLKNVIDWLPLRSWFNLVTHSITSKSKVKVINSRAGNVVFLYNQNLFIVVTWCPVCSQARNYMTDNLYAGRKTDGNLLLEYEEIINCSSQWHFICTKKQNVHICQYIAIWSTWMNWHTSIGQLGILCGVCHTCSQNKSVQHLDRSVHKAHWQDC